MKPQVHDMNIENRNHLLKYLTTLFNEYHIWETDDTFERDTELFKQIFPENAYRTDEENTNEYKRISFNLKEMGGMKIKFERIRIQDRFFNYSIIFSSPLIEEQSISLLSELEIGRNKNSREYCENLINDRINELYYYSMQFDSRKIEFSLNDRDKLIFRRNYSVDDKSLNIVSPYEIIYDDSEKQTVISKEEAIELIQTRYKLTLKIKDFIKKVADMNLAKEKEKLLNQMKKGNNSFNGEEMLNAMKDENFIDKDLIELSLKQMLNESEFYTFLPETLTEAFVSRKENYFDVFIEKLKEIRSRITEIGFQEAENVLDEFLSIDNKNVSKNDTAVRMYNFYTNSGPYLKQQLNADAQNRDILQEIFKRCGSRISRRIHREAHISLMKAQVQGTNLSSRSDEENDREAADLNIPYMLNNREDMAVQFFYGPFLLYRYLIPDIVKALNEFDVYFKDEDISKLFDPVRLARYQELKEELAEGKVKIENIKELFDILASLYKNLDNKFLLMAYISSSVMNAENRLSEVISRKEELTEQKNALFSPIKKHSLKKMIIDCDSEIDSLKNYISKRKKDRAEKSALMGDYRKYAYVLKKMSYLEDTPEMKVPMTDEGIRRIGLLIECFVSRVFIEYPFTLLEKDNNGESDFCIRTLKNGDRYERVCISQYFKKVLSRDLNSYVECVFDGRYEDISDEDGYASVLKEYIVKTKECRTLKEVYETYHSIFKDGADREKTAKNHEKI